MPLLRIASQPKTSPIAAATDVPSEDAGKRRQAPEFHGIGGDIGGPAEERRVAERRHADIADEQVEGAGEEREAQRLHQENWIEHEGRAKRGDEERHGDDAAGAGRHARRGGALGHRLRHRISRPKKPAGFTSSTIAMMTKIAVELASG